MPFPRLAAGLLLAGPLLAAAQPVAALPVEQSPAEQAAATQDALRQWIAGLLGPRVALGSHQPRVTAESDALRVEWPLAGPLADSGWTVDAGPVVAMVKPMEGGRWAISSLAWPASLEAQGPLPQPPQAEPAQRQRPSPSAPGAKSPQSAKPVLGHWSMHLGDQKVGGVFDPTLRTASTFDAAIRDEDVHFSTPQSTQTTHIGRLDVHYGWEPTDGDTVRMVYQDGVEDYRVVFVKPQTPPVTVSIGRIDDDTTVDGVSFARFGTVVQALAAVAGAVSAGEKREMQPEQRALLQQAVAALPDLIGQFKQSLAVSSIVVDAGGARASLAKLRFESGGEATGKGLASFSTRITAEGFDSPMIPPEMRPLVPHQAVLAVRASGLPGREISTILVRALDAGAPPPDAEDFTALLGRGPLALGLDELSFDLGPTAVTAEGEMQIPSPQDITGTLHVRATGFDALMTRAQTTPELTQMVPMLAMLKGFGRPQGEALVWDVVYAKGRTTVNGTDLTALTGGAPDAPRGARPQPPLQAHP